MTITKKLIAITFIFLCTAAAWLVLGATTFSRTNDLSSKLKGGVEGVWGKSQTQHAPSAVSHELQTQKTEEWKDSKLTTTSKQVAVDQAIPLASSKIDVNLALQPRLKGLLWYSTYTVQFQAAYAFDAAPAERNATLKFPLPSPDAVYDDIQVTSDGALAPFSVDQGAVVVDLKAPANKAINVAIGYRSRGLDYWQYQFGDQVTQVKNFSLTMNTDFKDINFPDSTISPTSKRESGAGWRLQWDYVNLLSGYKVGMQMPEKLQPGYLAGQISFFAPVSLFFFFFVIMLLTTLREIRLHPMHYFFLAGAFFAFHLLMAYLVDHISINAAFLISAVVSMLLVFTYLRRVIGTRFAAVEAAGTQFLYLVLFSYAFFFKGFTGLSVTIGSILTLFVAM